MRITICCLVRGLNPSSSAGWVGWIAGWVRDGGWGTSTLASWDGATSGGGGTGGRRRCGLSLHSSIAMTVETIRKIIMAAGGIPAKAAKVWLISSINSNLAPFGASVNRGFPSYLKELRCHYHRPIHLDLDQILCLNCFLQ